MSDYTPFDAISGRFISAHNTFLKETSSEIGRLRSALTEILEMSRHPSCDRSDIETIAEKALGLHGQG